MNAKRGEEATEDNAHTRLRARSPFVHLFSFATPPPPPAPAVLSPRGGVQMVSWFLLPIGQQAVGTRMQNLLVNAVGTLPPGLFMPKS